MDLYYLGTEVELDGSFVDINNNPVDPTTITITVRQPDGTLINEAPVVRKGPGLWSAKIVPTQIGMYIYLSLIHISEPTRPY